MFNGGFIKIANPRTKLLLEKLKQWQSRTSKLPTTPIKPPVAQATKSFTPASNILPRVQKPLKLGT